MAAARSYRSLTVVQAQLHDPKVVSGTCDSEGHTCHDYDIVGRLSEALGSGVRLGLLHNLLIAMNVLRANAVSTPEKAKALCHVLVRRDREDCHIRMGPSDAVRGAAPGGVCDDAGGMDRLGQIGRCAGNGMGQEKLSLSSSSLDRDHPRHCQRPTASREFYVSVRDSYEEAAKVCGCAEGTIKSRGNRARNRLEELLGLEDGSDLHGDQVVMMVLPQSGSCSLREILGACLPCLLFA